MQKLDPKSDGAARDWVAIYDECSRILYEEINYRKEAEYARDFAANFAGTDWVKVPEIYTEYLSPEVIVMEYVPGVKINNGEAIDEMGLDREKLARYAVESYLQQLLRHGLFHADPHPGNVAVDAANGGRLIYYDFGMMGRIQPRVRCVPLVSLLLLGFLFLLPSCLFFIYCCLLLAIVFADTRRRCAHFGSRVKAVDTASCRWQPRRTRCR